MGASAIKRVTGVCHTLGPDVNENTADGGPDEYVPVEMCKRISIMCLAESITEMKLNISFSSIRISLRNDVPNVTMHRCRSK